MDSRIIPSEKRFIALSTATTLLHLAVNWNAPNCLLLLRRVIHTRRRRVMVKAWEADIRKTSRKTNRKRRKANIRTRDITAASGRNQTHVVFSTILSLMPILLPRLTVTIHMAAASTTVRLVNLVREVFRLATPSTSLSHLPNLI